MNLKKAKLHWLIHWMRVSSSTLLINLDVDFFYGNQAARLYGGWGDGRWWVHAVLTVVDPATKAVKFRAVAESEQSIGVFGGDMDETIKSNIVKIIQQYSTSRAGD